MNKITLSEFGKFLVKKNTTLIFFIAFLLFSVNSYTQINYTSVNLTGSAAESYDIDLDGDGTDDFNISSGNFLGDYLNITPLGTNAVISVVDNSPTVLLDGDLIDGTSTWDADASQGLYYNFLGFIVIGNWENVSNSYLGLQFSINGNIHYAWIQLSITDNATWEIIDYAYEETPNIGVLAGSTITLGVEHEFSSDVRVFSFNQELKILNLPEKSNYKLYSSLGQLVDFGVADRNSFIINTTRFNTGMYVLKVVGNDSGKTLTKKLILQ